MFRSQPQAGIPSVVPLLAAYLSPSDMGDQPSIKVIYLSKSSVELIVREFRQLGPYILGH